MVEVFVTSDFRPLDAARAISSALRYPAVSSGQRISLSPSKPAPAARTTPVCPVCGCRLPTAHGIHARIQ